MIIMSSSPNNIQFDRLISFDGHFMFRFTYMRCNRLLKMHSRDGEIENCLDLHRAFKFSSHNFFLKSHQISRMTLNDVMHTQVITKIIKIILFLLPFVIWEYSFNPIVNVCLTKWLNCTWHSIKHFIEILSLRII